MRRRLLRRAAPIAGTILTVTLGIVPLRSGQSAEQKMDGGHSGHHMMKEQTVQTSRKPGEVTPKGWRFGLPPGRVEAGRQAFIDFECFKCHAVQGEKFPVPGADQPDVGPALSGMGGMHPAEYLAETIMNPNASAAWRIAHHKAEKKNYLDAHGKTKMPSYNGSMTVQQLLDLVAYLKSLTSTSGHKH
jgi:mono/diheme cytochrome c family protein